MAKAWFLVLCRNEGDEGARERTKAPMHDCKVSGAKPTAACRHAGERDFSSTDAAVRRMCELKGLAGRDAIDISVRVKFHG